MALNPLGNTIYTNQQTASVASSQNSQQNRLDLQNFIAGEIAKEKEAEVLEVRPTEETHETDPDAKRQQQEDDEKARLERERKEKEEANEKIVQASHILDIKI